MIGGGENMPYLGTADINSVPMPVPIILIRKYQCRLSKRTTRLRAPGTPWRVWTSCSNPEAHKEDLQPSFRIDARGRNCTPDGCVRGYTLAIVALSPD